MFPSHDLGDGPFFEWTSEQLSAGTNEDNFYTSINKFNPFVTVKVTGTLVGQPDVGSYALQGGGPHVRAEVSPSGTGFKFEAIAEGDSFNDLKVDVTAPTADTRQFTILDRLSEVKFRTPHYNISLFRDVDDLEGLLVPIQENQDLEDNPFLLATTAAGSALAPFYPFTSLM